MARFPGVVAGVDPGRHKRPVAGPLFDPTRDDVSFTVTSPGGERRKKGDVRKFTIWTQPADADFAPGRRLARAEGLGAFAFVDEFGVHVWGRFKGDGKRSPADWYADMIERPSVYQAKGYKYEIIGS